MCTQSYVVTLVMVNSFPKVFKADIKPSIPPSVKGLDDFVRHCWSGGHE